MAVDRKASKRIEPRGVLIFLAVFVCAFAAASLLTLHSLRAQEIIDPGAPPEEEPPQDIPPPADSGMEPGQEPDPTPEHDLPEPPMNPEPMEPQDDMPIEPEPPYDSSYDSSSPDANGSFGGQSGDSKPPVARIDLKNQPARTSDSIPEGEDLVNIDFPEPTEIKDIIKAVALWTGKNVILDRNVSGKVQIISPRRVTKVEAYQAFLSALNILNLTTVETGQIIKIMRINSAIRGNLRTYMGKWAPRTDKIITQIIPLRYIDADEVNKTLARIVTANSVVVYKPTNTLIVSDTGYKIRRILEILELLDVKTQQPQVSMVPIRYGDAKSIAQKVQEIFQAGGNKQGAYHTYKIMTDDRSNSVIIFGPPLTIKDVKALVQQFDVEVEDPSRQSSIHVRLLDYADAKKIASTLSALATGSKTGSVASSIRSRVPAGSTIRPGGRAGVSGVAEDPTVAELDDNVKITADESTNALLITGSRGAYQALNSIIRKLDIRRSQVYVEAEVLDINEVNNFSFGTSIFGGYGKEDGSGTKIGAAWEAGGVAPLVISNVDSAAGNPPTSAASAAAAFKDNLTIGILSGEEVDIPGLGKFSPAGLINMIKGDSNSKVLASPHLLTANNEEADIVVGEKIFFPSSTTNPTTGVAVPKAESADVDLNLNIKPSISHSNYVTLKIKLESNSVSGIDPDTKLPTISRRVTSQLLTVKNKQTVVISGLVSTTEQDSYKKIPLLGDIPIIGWLFRNSSIIRRQSNLMIFLTPHIVHGAEDLAQIYREKLVERDDMMNDIYGSGFKDNAFYSKLPTQSDGEYKSDAIDVSERQRLERLRRQMQEDDPMYDPRMPDRTAPEPVSVPVGGPRSSSSIPSSTRIPDSSIAPESTMRDEDNPGTGVPSQPDTAPEGGLEPGTTDTINERGLTPPGSTPPEVELPTDD